MHIDYKNNFYNIFGFIFILLFIYALFIYLIDPLQEYRLSTLFKPVYSNEIYQNPGLAKHAEYDSVIIGSSMTENFRPSYISKILGLKALKLSIAGANSYEEKETLATCIATNKVKYVIYGIDIFRLADNQLRQGFPSYLYSEFGPINQMRYLFNIGNISFVIKMLLATSGIAYKTESDLDLAYNWNAKVEYSVQNVIQEYKEELRKTQKEFYSLNDMKKNFNNNVLSFIVNNPNIHFYLFYPPYSTYTYQLYEHKGIMVSFLEMKKYIFEATKHFPNVKIYDFQNDSRIINNLHNYKDTSHYSENINNYIIDSFAKNDYLVKVV